MYCPFECGNAPESGYSSTGASKQARLNEGSYSELVPLEDGRFFSRTLYAYIDFQEDESGSIAKMLWINNDGNTFEGVKE